MAATLLAFRLKVLSVTFWLAEAARVIGSPEPTIGAPKASRFGRNHQRFFAAASENSTKSIAAKVFRGGRRWLEEEREL